VLLRSCCCSVAHRGLVCGGPIPGRVPGTEQTTGATLGGQYLADRYPCDQGIAGDPAVVWAENFEEGSVSAVTARYNDHKNPAGMALVADRPSSSCGAVSMQLTSDGRNSTSQATDLYKRFDAGQDELYWRWYVKYQAGVPWHHTGLWLGGLQTPRATAEPQAGIRPSGNDRVSFAIEPVWGNGASNPAFDFYNYWMTDAHLLGLCGLVLGERPH